MENTRIIKILYPYIQANYLAEYLGISRSKVYNLAFLNGIKKDPKTKYKQNKEKLLKASKNSRFKQGHETWNKGKKCPNLLLTNAATTMFKKGEKNHNTKPNNSISIRKDTEGRNYMYYKIADSNWVLYHRYLWEQANGPIPKAHVVTFIDGNTMNIELSNLQMISMKENAIRNSIQRFPDELKQVIRLKTKLNKQIKNGTKRNE